MAILAVPRQLAQMDCFHMAINELVGMLGLLNDRYEARYGGGGRQFALANNGQVTVTANPQTIAENDRQFGFLYYTLNRRVILLVMMVQRNLVQNPIHDIIRILRVKYSTEPLDEGWATAYFDPSSLSFAATTTRHLSGCGLGEIGVLEETGPEMVVNRDDVQPGCDLSDAQAPEQIVARMDQDRVIDNPAYTIDSLVNLNLTRGGAAGQQRIAQKLQNLFQNDL